MADTQAASISLSSLPDQVRRYFLSPEIFLQYQSLASEYGFDKQKISLFSTAVFQFAIGSISEEDFLKRLSTITGFSEAKVRELLPTIAIKILFPVAREMPGLSEKISVFGVTSATGEPVSAMTLIRSFIASFPESVEPNIQHRLENLLSEYVSEKRSKEDLIEFLQRPYKLAGLNLDAQSARELVESFDEKKTGANLLVIPTESGSQTERTERSPELRDPSARPSSSLGMTEASEEHVSVFWEDEIAEVEKIAEEKKEIIEQAPVISIEEMVKRICSNAQFQFFDPALQKRCVDLVTAHVRGVRDGFQTREFFERGVDAGGLGMSGRRLSDMIEQMEHVVDAAEKEKHQTIQQEKQDQEMQKQEEKKKKEELIEKEEQVMAKRFVQATGKVPNERVVPAAPPLLRASAAVSAHMQLQQQEARIDTQKIRAAIVQTVKQEPAPAAVPRSRVQDVQLAPRLAGPTEELQQMSLTEFRRLASNPTQASERIKDVIGLLADQGYSQRVAGVQALRRSPLLQAYSSITTQALLSGTSVDVVLSNQKGKDGMKKTEYEALMQLNAELRF